MSDDKYIKDDPERTLITLDQLSQTIEVMTSVVNRLRRHLSEQIKAQLKNPEQGQWEVQLEALLEAQKATELESDPTSAESVEPPQPVAKESQSSSPKNTKRESFVVEINSQETATSRKTTKILH